MNDVSAKAAAPDPATTVDESNPWLGLASFSEETRAYFFGREEEVAELARRVQRKLLTLLFGQSGLGKTSILRAGVVPRLRTQGYCPIYVRLDYAREAPEPAEQIKQAIMQSARLSGQWTQAGVAAPGESLWEFLHHRDDVLRDESGATLIPFLIFDQFEEIFTLAQSDEFGRARAARFIAELADLVENRPPKAFEAKLEEDQSAAERFDFTRSDYRVLIALREDYLAPLEGLKKDIPSISQNRLRLAPMTGTQALAAVLRPGRKLVSEEVAAAIVRFVAGGAELANAEVEPALLSLICRELNDARIAQGRSEISLDLLAGSHATILSNFYERALADQPPAVRRIIEDELLTVSGFRENVAEERLLSHFAEAGAAPGTLALLVNRRLLRIEERLDIRRVELTHDVLCTVVKSSRDQRHEREAREATERLLAGQRARELAARRAMVRARQVAAGCTVLAILAVVAAVFAYFNSQRAQRAEREAQETRAQAEQARGQAEHLLGYLSDDFARELESFGRLNVLAEFSQRQIDYFHALPEALKGTETIRNGALALVHHARALRWLGDTQGAGDNADEAAQLLARLRNGGDHSEATAIALALAYVVKAQILDNKNDAAGPAAARRAAELLRPLAEAANASVAARRAYVETLVRIGFEQTNSNHSEDAVRAEREAQRIATDLGARDLSNLDMGAYYAEAGAWLTEALIAVGRNHEARRAGEDSIALADRVLERRPGYRLALHAQQVIETNLGNVEQNDLNPLEAARIGLRGEQISLMLLKLDPNNVVSINNLGASQGNVGDALWGAGRLHAAMPYYLQQLDDMGHASSGGAGFAIIRSFTMAGVAYRQAVLGDTAAAAATIAAGAPYLAQLRQREPAGSIAVTIVDAIDKLSTAWVGFARDDLPTARRIDAQAVAQLEAATPHGGLQEFEKQISLYVAYHIEGRAEYQQGDFAAAERSERKALAARKAAGGESISDQRDRGELATWIAMAVARQGRLGDAAQTIGPVVKFQREMAAKNHGDQWLPMELAAALYAQALSDPGKSAPLLREAAGLIASLAPELRPTHDVRLWRELIRRAQTGSSAQSGAAAVVRSAG
jgi:hypothetical protein